VPTAAVLSHHDIAHELGHLEPWLNERGYVIERVYRGDEGSIDHADLLVVMGSPTSVATGYLLAPAEEEISMVREWVGTGRPYLGLCFGAQVLAKALGGEVNRLDRTFRGYVDCTSSLASEVSFEGPWVVWHDDAITAPPGAEVFARLPHADLAFRVGNAWGLQPHIEVTPASLQQMAIALGAPEAAYAPLVGDLSADEISGRPARIRVAQFLDAAFGTIR
jgi:GMP synthase-like glutamine amidotransferase